MHRNPEMKTGLCERPNSGFGQRTAHRPSVRIPAALAPSRVEIRTSALRGIGPNPFRVRYRIEDRRHDEFRFGDANLALLGKSADQTGTDHRDGFDYWDAPDPTKRLGNRPVLRQQRRLIAEAAREHESRLGNYEAECALADARRSSVKGSSRARTSVGNSSMSSSRAMAFHTMNDRH